MIKNKASLSLLIICLLQLTAKATKIDSQLIYMNDIYNFRIFSGTEFACNDPECRVAGIYKDWYLYLLNPQDKLKAECIDSD